MDIAVAIIGGLIMGAFFTWLFSRESQDIIFCDRDCEINEALRGENLRRH